MVVRPRGLSMRKAGTPSRVVQTPAGVAGEETDLLEARFLDKAASLTLRTNYVEEGDDA